MAKPGPLRPDSVNPGGPVDDARLDDDAMGPPRESGSTISTARTLGIERMVEEVLRPLFTADGGDIELIKLAEDEVVLELSGAAAYCVGSYFTRVHVIEPAIRRAVGHAVAVKVVNRAPSFAKKKSASVVSERDEPTKRLAVPKD